ncbi:MAG: T9SS type A sorting domain-containing protein [Ignavibacteria bacterium]|nr:T9SS type A sorting domain-containing protein [Ignavibacteria bacterium]
MKSTNYAVLIIAFLLLVSFSYSQWQPDVRLTNDPALSFSGEDRCISVNGNSIHVVWQEHRDGDAEIYYKRSTNRGDSWSADTRLSSTPHFSGAPSIAANQSVVHITWQDQRTSGTLEIYYLRSTDNGITWGPEVGLTNDPQSSYYPSISVSGTLVYILWEDNRDGNYEIYFKRSTNSGANWSSDMRLTNNSAASNYVSAACSGINIHCSWQDTRDGSTEIYYKNSTDAGVTWSADARLTNDPAASTGSNITVTGANVNVFWSDQRNGNYEIYFKRSTSGGSNWGPDTRLTNAVDNSLNPCAFSYGPLTAFIWSDMRTGYYKVYYKASSDGGTNWSADLLLSQPGLFGSAFNASIGISDSAAHIVWNDNKDGNQEIYYKRNIFSFPVGITNNNSDFPAEFSLSQNYPNPFNPSTTINFQIPADGKRHAFNTQLIVYDIMGKEVKVLVNKLMQPGNYSIDFDGSSIASGMYFYRITSGEFSDTKKLVLVK